MMARERGSGCIQRDDACTYLPFIIIINVIFPEMWTICLLK